MEFLMLLVLFERGYRWLPFELDNKKNVGLLFFSMSVFLGMLLTSFTPFWVGFVVIGFLGLLLQLLREFQAVYNGDKVDSTGFVAEVLGKINGAGIILYLLAYFVARVLF